MKHYYVSYSVSTANNSTLGFSSAEISVDNEISEFSHIKKINELIESDLIKKGYIKPNVCVLNYQLLRSE